MKISKLQELIFFVLMNTGPVSQLKLAKPVYLIEWRYYSKLGSQLTKAWYLRERRGPVPESFGKDLDKMRGFEVEPAPQGRLGPGRRPRFQPSFEEEARRFIIETLRRYQHKSERDLLLATYLTPPMKSILKEERGGAERKHHGVVFGRFPQEAKTSAAPERIAENVVEHVAPEDVADADMRNIMEAFAESVPFIRTAEDLLAADNSETA